MNKPILNAKSMFLTAGVAFMLLLTLSMSAAAYTNSAAKTTAAPASPTTVSILISCADYYENCGTQSDSSGIIANVPFTEAASVEGFTSVSLETGASLGGGAFSELAACGQSQWLSLSTDTYCASSPNPTGAFFVASGVSWKWVHNPYPNELGTTNAKWVLQVKFIGLVAVFTGEDENIIYEGAGSVTVLCQSIATSGIAHVPQGPAFYGQQDVVGSTNGGILSNSFVAEVGCAASIP